MFHPNYVNKQKEDMNVQSLLVKLKQKPLIVVFFLRFF